MSEAARFSCRGAAGLAALAGDRRGYSLVFPGSRHLLSVCGENWCGCGEPGSQFCGSPDAMVRALSISSVVQVAFIFLNIAAG